MNMELIVFFVMVSLLVIAILFPFAAFLSVLL
jgi:hypothetical protein